VKEGNHTHQFVNHYQGLVGFGLDRETDEKSLMVYLQKFSDDTFLGALLPRLSAEEIEEIFGQISRILKTHLKEEEYHRLFLKEEDDSGEHSPDTREALNTGPEPGEAQLRWLCSKKGLDWELLSEKEREEFLLDITRV
jgi:hypothetical protein